MLEYPKEELLKKSCIELTVSEDKEKTKESLKHIITSIPSKVYNTYMNRL